MAKRRTNESAKEKEDGASLQVPVVNAPEVRPRDRVLERADLSPDVFGY